MAIDESSMDEKEFTDSLERALHTIKSGMKVGADNLEMILDGKDIGNLGLGMIDVLNRCEIEYKQGKGNKVFSLNKMVSAYHAGNKEGVRKLFNKCRDVEELRQWYDESATWLGYIDKDSDIWPEHFGQNPEGWMFEPEKGKLPESACIRHMFYLEAEPLIPPSMTYARQFVPHNEIKNLYKTIKEKLGRENALGTKEKDRNAYSKLKRISSDKFAYTRAEILGMLDLYHPPQDNKAYT